MSHVEVCTEIIRAEKREVLLRSTGNPHDDNEVWLCEERLLVLKDQGECYWTSFPCAECDPSTDVRPAEVLIPKGLLVAWRLTRE